MIFYPYDAGQLQDILEHRVKMALKSQAIDDDVIPLCSALAAQEHGDARRALDLLRVSAEIAERSNAKRITNRDVRVAQHKIEIDHITEVVRTLPNQSKLILFSVLLINKQNKKEGANQMMTTGEVFETYRDLCKKARYDCLTQRRITDLVSELDMLGIITARVISKGRYGRTREIQVPVSTKDLLVVLQEDDMFKDLANYKTKSQTRLTV